MQAANRAMNRGEAVNSAGLRADGRRPPEIRRVVCKVGTDSSSDGSAYLEMGNTKVLVTVSGPHEADNFSKSLHDKAIISCEFSMAAYASAERKTRGKRDKRNLEIAATLKQSFEHVIMTQLFPRSQFDIFIHAIQEDGGVLPAAINATTLALVDAGIPLRDMLVACVSGTSSLTCIHWIDANARLCTVFCVDCGFLPPVLQDWSISISSRTSTMLKCRLEHHIFVLVCYHEAKS